MGGKNSVFRKPLGTGSGSVARKLGGVTGGLVGERAPAPSLSIPKANEAEARAALKRDIATGKELFGGDFKEGNLGRLSTERSAEMADIIARKKAGLEGFSSEEAQALRERGGQEITRSTQTALRQLRGLQGASGVRGASAVAGQAGILQAGQAAKANVERDLFIQNINQKRQALGDLESSVSGQEALSRQAEIFNIGQKSKEIAGRQASGLGFAALGATERASQRGVGVALANAKAASSGGKK